MLKVRSGDTSGKKKKKKKEKTKTNKQTEKNPPANIGDIRDIGLIPG